MSPLIIATALSLLALDATPTISQTVAVAPAKVDAQAKTDTAKIPEKKICRSQAITGSRFERRICMTRTNWTDLEQRRARTLDDFERQLGFVAGLPGGHNDIGAN